MSIFTHRYNVSPSEAGQRVDIFLTQCEPGISRSQIQQLMHKLQVRVNGQPAKPHYIIKAGDRLDLELPEPKPPEAGAESISLDIVYEDRHLVVVNKPAGMVVHPAAGNFSGTLVNALLGRYGSLSNIGAPLRPGIVHRLDKFTSGLMIAARSDIAHLALVRQIAQRQVQRIYWALAWGVLEQNEGRIEVSLGRHVADRKRISPLTRSPKSAITHYRVLKRFPGLTLVELKLDTGRTHQIRAHLAHIGHPVFGDHTYGKKTSLTVKSAGKVRQIYLTRQALHAKKLEFAHPVTGEQLKFEAPLPEDMQRIIETLSQAEQD